MSRGVEVQCPGCHGDGDYAAAVCGCVDDRMCDCRDLCVLCDGAGVTTWLKATAAKLAERHSSPREQGAIAALAAERVEPARLIELLLRYVAADEIQAAATRKEERA